MLIAIVILLALAVGAAGGYLYGAKALRAVEYERDVLKGEIKKLASYGYDGFREWKARFAAARDKLEGK
jgi:hypothetical protein